MKAFMSNASEPRIERAVRRRTPEERERGVRGMWITDALAEAAEREARAILAHTEPLAPCRDTFNVGRVSATEHSNIGPLAMCHEPYKALAESLARFIALPLEGEKP